MELSFSFPLYGHDLFALCIHCRINFFDVFVCALLDLILKLFYFVLRYILFCKFLECIVCITDRNISILAENHGYLVKKFNEAVEAAHNNHVNTVQTSYLIEHVANLENRMQAVEKNMAL